MLTMRATPNERGPPHMDYVLKLDGYLNADGRFDYQKYKDIQERANKRKIDRVFVTRPSIALLAGYIRRHLGDGIKFGICHGTRRGNEQAWFSNFLGCDVLGTEISSTATDFPNTIQWDFHDTKAEWAGAADFVYSNSWDHAFDPERAFKAWASCLRPNGLMVLEHAQQHTGEATNTIDPFGIEVDALCALLEQLDGAHLKVREVLSVRDVSEAGSQKGIHARSFVIAEKAI